MSYMQLLRNPTFTNPLTTPTVNLSLQGWIQLFVEGGGISTLLQPQIAYTFNTSFYSPSPPPIDPPMGYNNAAPSFLFFHPNVVNTHISSTVFLTSKHHHVSFQKSQPDELKNHHNVRLSSKLSNIEIPKIPMHGHTFYFKFNISFWWCC